MSDDVIRVGDLVCVVKPKLCCGNAKSIGLIFTVLDIESLVECIYCGKEMELSTAIDADGYGVEVFRLKKINSTPISETIETQEELTI